LCRFPAGSLIAHIKLMAVNEDGERFVCFIPNSAQNQNGGFSIMNVLMLLTVLFVALVVLIGVIGLFIWKPRTCTQVFAVLAFAAGVAGIVSGICFLTVERGEGSLFLLPHEAIWVLGGGSGLLVGGIVALVLSFVGQRKRTENV
jgi:hypothetical protein